MESEGPVPCIWAMEQGGADRPMLVLISGVLLLGGIAAFMGWGLTHAYPAG